MEAIVTLHTHYAKDSFRDELEADGRGCIQRACTCTDRQDLSKRNVTFDLTEAEIEELKQDGRVRGIIAKADLNNIPIGVDTIQPINPVFNFDENQTHDNWGLAKATQRSVVDPFSSTYRYSHDGEGVDVVIVDTGIMPNHPEFDDGFGSSRVQQIEWQSGQATARPQYYNDEDGHGTHVAGIVAGATQGWAKKAHIYSMKIYLGGQIDSYGILEGLQLVHAWHNGKSNGRPTVVNNSWSYYNTYPSNYPDTTRAGTNHPWPVVSVDAEIEDMIADGIIFTCSAGNDAHTIANSLDPLYDDVYYVKSNGDWTSNISEAAQVRLHNTGTPQSTGICVGAQGDYVGFPYQPHTIAGYSNKGSRVDIFAAGTAIQSCNYNYQTESNLKKLSGTSMACPQVTGILALYAQMNPTANQADAIEWLTTHANTSTIPDSPINTVDASPHLSIISIYNGVYVKDAGVWKLVLQPSVKDGGVWKNPESVYVKDSGSWIKAFG